jgi:acetyl-CoA acetyltransferase family protein
MAALLAGFPTAVPGTTVNRLCGSSMEAVVQAARAIAVGDADLMVAGGVESMSRAPFVIPKAEAAYPRDTEIHATTIGWRQINPKMAAMGHVDPLGVTAENVAEEYEISREDQDAFAFRSQRRAAAAINAGRLAEEIIPLTVPGGHDEVVDEDEHPRPDITREQLAALRPAFREGGTVTAGNSSGVNDGAAALLLASQAAVDRYDLVPLARVTGSAVAGVPPRIMGIGPIPATSKLLDRAGLSWSDVGLLELNEAFASQALACLRGFGLPDDADHVNPNGGAIALGHPTGMSGGRITGTAALELHKRGIKTAVATMCIGVGQGIAVLLEAA